MALAYVFWDSKLEKCQSRYFREHLLLLLFSDEILAEFQQVTLVVPIIANTYIVAG